MRFPIIFCILLTVCRCISAEASRFARILQLYKQYGYEYDEQAFTLQLRNATRRNSEIEPLDSTSLARVDTRTRNLWIHAGYESQGLQSDSTRELWSRFRTTIAYERNEGGRADPRIQTVEAIVDTLAERIFVDARIERELTGYVTQKGPDILTPLLGINARAVTRAYYDWDELQIQSAGLEDGHWQRLLFPHYFVKKDYGIAGNLRILPFVGIGRMTPTRPVEAALDLEEELVRSGLADFELSDETVARIAVLISKHHNRRLRSHDNLKAFKRKLDSLLIRDMAVKSRNQRFLSSFAVSRAILRKPPLHKSGLTAQVYFLEEVEAAYRRLRREFPYDTDNVYPDTNETGPAFDGYGRLGVRVRYGTAFARNVAFSFSGEKVLLTGENSDHPDPYKTPDVDYSAEMILRPLQWLQVKCGAYRVPTKVVIPTDLPGKLYADVTVFVEDYFRVLWGISYCNREALRSNRYYFRYTSEVQPAEGPAMNAYLLYSF